MTYTYCMTSNCALAKNCARYEDDAGKHLLTRTYADFSEESGTSVAQHQQQQRQKTHGRVQADAKH